MLLASGSLNPGQDVFVDLIELNQQRCKRRSLDSCVDAGPAARSSSSMFANQASAARSPVWSVATGFKGCDGGVMADSARPSRPTAIHASTTGSPSLAPPPAEPLGCESIGSGAASGDTGLAACGSGAVDSLAGGSGRMASAGGKASTRRHPRLESSSNAVSADMELAACGWCSKTGSLAVGRPSRPAATHASRAPLAAMRPPSNPSDT